MPAQSLLFSNIAANYPADSHSSMRFRLLGDGTSGRGPREWHLSADPANQQHPTGPRTVGPFSLVLCKNASRPI